MDSILQMSFTELAELGFHIDGSKAIGRVPNQGDVNGKFITVEISLEGFPYRQPKIRLLGINDRADIYKAMPRDWRHIDEEVSPSDIKHSQFFICCLHNWSPDYKFRGKYVYLRVLEWLRSNCTGTWKEEEDLPGWRILPQRSFSTLYLDEQLLTKITKMAPQEIYQGTLHHDPYAAKALPKEVAHQKSKGNLVPLSSINFERLYSFFTNLNATNRFTKIANQHLDINTTIQSDLRVLRMPAHFQFKTLYQLLKSIIDNFNWSAHFKEGERNIPILVMFSGEAGRKEPLAFIVDRRIFNGTVEVDRECPIIPLKIDALPIRGAGVNKKIGVLGVGTLGSQICSLLVKKNVGELLISDPDVLSMHNLDSHVLGSIFLGMPKSLGLQRFFMEQNQYQNITAKFTDEEVIDQCDILIVAVGDSSAFDRLLIHLKDKNFAKPVIWTWMSQQNILQDVVVTTPDSGCLNCYYKYMPQIGLHQRAQIEIGQVESFTVDSCGNPHTISIIEKTVFLATQIVSLIENYDKSGCFPFSFANFYWGVAEPFPIYETGELAKSDECFCGGHSS